MKIDYKELKTSDNELRLLKSIFFTMQTSLLLVDDNALIQYINPAFTKLLGYEEHELIKQPIEILIPKRFHLAHKEHLKKYFQKLCTCIHKNGKKSFFCTHKNGNEIQTDIAITPVHIPGNLLILCEIIDVSRQILTEQKLQSHVQEKTKALQKEIEQHKKTEYALRTSEKHYRTLTSISPVGVFHCDPQGFSTFMNQRGCEIIGHSDEENRGYGWVKALHPDDHQRVMDEWADSARRGAAFLSEHRFLHKNGDVCWVIAQMAEERDEKGAVISYVGTLTDITQLKTAQTQLQQQRDQLCHLARFNLGKELSSSLAHELNQPLSSIVQYAGGCAERLKRENISDEILHNLNTIIIQAEHAGEIINNLKNFLSRGYSEISKIDINELIKNSIQLVAFELTNASVELRLQLDTALPEIIANKIQIQQALINLIHNAMEALIEAKTNKPIITIRTKKMDKQAVQIEISDTGPGISEENISNIFTPFFTSKKDGMGIGLTLVRSIVEAHRSNIDVKSELGNGANFIIVLPENNPEL